MKKNNALKNSVYYLLLAVIVNAIPFLTLPVFTRFLSPADYGVIGLSAAFGMFLSGVAHMGMSLAYQRNYFQYRHDLIKSGAHLYSTLLFVLFNAGLCFIALYFCRGWVSRMVFQQPGLGRVLLLDFMACYAIGVGQYFLVHFQNAGEARRFFDFSLIQAGVTTAASFILICGFHTGMIGMIYAKLFGAVLTCIMLLGYFLRRYPVSFDMSILMANVKLSAPLTLRTFFKPVASNFDKWLVNALTNLSGAGVYAVAQKYSYVGFAATTALDQVYVPRTLEMMFDAGKDAAGAIARYLMPFFYFSLFFCLGVCFFSEEAIRLLLPPAFYGAIDVTAILALYYGLMFFGKLPHFLYSGKTFLIVVLSFASLCVTVGLCWVLVPRFGAVGAASGMLISCVLVETVTFFIRQKLFYIRWPYRQLLLLVLMFLIFGLSVVLMRHMSVNYWYALLAKGIFMGAYLFYGFHSGFWHWGHLKEMGLMIRRKISFIDQSEAAVS